MLQSLANKASFRKHRKRRTERDSRLVRSTPNFDPALMYLSVDEGITKRDNASNYHLIFKYLRSSASIIYFYFKNRSSDESSMLPKSIPP